MDTTTFDLTPCPRQRRSGKHAPQSLAAHRQQRYRDRLRQEREEAARQKPPITYVELVKEVRRISMGGVCPSPERFDYCKPAVWPKAAELCDALGVTWQDVAEDAGLRERVRG